MKTNDLKTSITTAIKTAGTDSVYEFTRVPSDAVFPYVTYQFGTSIESLRDIDTDVDIPLQIDILDYRKDKNTDAIEDLVDAVDTALNRKDVIEDEFYYRLNRVNILQQLPTPNEFVFRRQLIYTLTYMERS